VLPVRIESLERFSLLGTLAISASDVQKAPSQMTIGA